MFMPKNVRPRTRRERIFVPMLKGCDPETISKNIEELFSKGHSRDEAVAIAYSFAEDQGCEIKDE